MESNKNTEVRRTVKTAILLALACVMSVSALTGCSTTQKQAAKPASGQSQSQSADQSKPATSSDAGKKSKAQQPAASAGDTQQPEAGAQISVDSKQDKTQHSAAAPAAGTAQDKAQQSAVSSDTGKKDKVQVHRSTATAETDKKAPAAAGR